MKRLDTYVTNQFIKNIVTIITALITIYLLIDFIEKYDNFTEKGKPIGLVLKFFLLNIPFILEQMGPVCILLAGVVTLGLLTHNNELIALKACGIPLRRIILPILVSGTVTSLLLLTMSQFVLPVTMAITNRIWIEEVRGKVPLGIYRNGRYYYRGAEGFFSFLRPDLKKNYFRSFSFSSWNEDYHLSTLVASATATYDKDTWNLYSGQQQTNLGGEKFKTTIFRAKNFDFAETPSDFFVPEYRTKELSLTGLFLEAKHQRTKADSNRVWVEFYGRISYILLGLPLLLVGLPLLLMVYRKWGRDLALAIPVSCGLAFVCWGMWGTQQSLAKASYLSPFLAASSIHLVIGSVGVYLILREDA